MTRKIGDGNFPSKRAPRERAAEPFAYLKTGAKPRYDIKELVLQMKGKTAPPIVDWGPPVGKEIW